MQLMAKKIQEVLVAGFYFFILFAVAFGIFSFPTYAQSVYSRKYSIKEGLPSSETYAVFQDSKGYIWIASDGGVARFNGKDYTIFTTSNGLPDNTIFNFYEDFKGRLWFISYSGNLAYFQNNQIQKVFPDGEISKLLKNHLISSIAIDSLDNLWLATDINLYRINFKTKIFIPEEISIPSGYFIKKIGKDYIWGAKAQDSETINTSYFFNYISHNHNFKLSTPEGYQVKTNFGLSVNRQGGILFHNYFYQISFNEATGKIKSIKPDYITISTYCDTRGKYWIGTKKQGVYLYNENPVGSKPYKQFLEGLSVSSVLEDREGGVWFSTLEEGVFYFPGAMVDNVLNNDRLLKFTKVIVYNDSTVYGTIADYGAFRATTNSFEELVFPEYKKFVSGINTFLDSRGEIWFGITSNSVVYDPVSQKSVSFIHEPQTIVAFAEDKVGNIWLASHGELFRILKEDYLEKKISKRKQVEKRIQCMTSGLNNEIWIGAINGLWKLEKDSLIFWGGRHPFLSNRIDDIKILESGDLLIATRGSGIGIYDYKDVEVIDASNGLSSNLCRTLAYDGKKTAWVGTNNGLSKIILEKGHYDIFNYTTHHGLLSNEINSIALTNEKIWVASNLGLSLFDPRAYLKKTSTPPVLIKNLKAGDSLYNPLQPIVLNYKKPFIEITYEFLSYINPNNTRFSYRLLGLDTNWRTTTNTAVEFTKLTPGKYTFEITAEISGANKQNKPSTLHFEIVPPIWGYWWFSFSVILMVFFLIAVFIRYRNIRYKNKLARRFNYERKLANLELKALRSQMNPHFIFNCMGSIQNLILKNDNEAAENYLTKFSGLLRNVLTLSGQNLVSLEQEVNATKEYLELESLRFTEGFNYNFEIDASIDISKIEIPPMLVQPFVENAIWHGLHHKQGKKQLTIRIQRMEGGVSLSITDNGIGRQKSKELNKELRKFKSLGISLIKERLYTINQYSNQKICLEIEDLVDGQQQSAGTKVNLTLSES
jgi:ligand-binding sensor domain-containing protein